MLGKYGKIYFSKYFLFKIIFFLFLKNLCMINNIKKFKIFKYMFQIIYIKKGSKVVQYNQSINHRWTLGIKRLFFLENGWKRLVATCVEKNLKGLLRQTWKLGILRPLLIVDFFTPQDFTVFSNNIENGLYTILYFF